MRAVATLEATKGEGEWPLAALKGFDRLWDVMTPENRQRLVGAVVEGVTVSGGRNQIELDEAGGPRSTEMRAAS